MHLTLSTWCCISLAFTYHHTLWEDYTWSPCMTILSSVISYQGNTDPQMLISSANEPGRIQDIIVWTADARL